MGLSLSILISSWKKILNYNLFDLPFDINFSTKHGGEVILRVDSFKRLEHQLSLPKAATNNNNNEVVMTKPISSNFKNHKPQNVVLERNMSFTDLVIEQEEEKTTAVGKNGLIHKPMPTLSLPQQPELFFSPRPVSELHAAAVKLQKVYKSYRTRRNLADCAVVVEELWWKALDFAALKRSSVSFFRDDKQETAVSRWARARTRAAKVGKGLSKDDKAQKLALQHWLEAIDPRHRYGHNLHMYYDVWFISESSQPFFYWLDVGDGKEVYLEKCPRHVLHKQCIRYLGPVEREEFEVIIEDGKLMYKQNGSLVETIEGSKWIFVLSTTRVLYVGKKKKGTFQHSSFLAGAAITAAGRLVAHNGVIEAIWPYSGHYHPTEENFKEFVGFLEENGVNLTNVKMYAVDDDNLSIKKVPSIKVTEPEPNVAPTEPVPASNDGNSTDVEKTTITAVHQDQQQEDNKLSKGDDKEEAPRREFSFSKHLSCKWSTGNGPRIGCVRDYPANLQSRALEQVNLSPRVGSGPVCFYGPIPSPRPSPKLRVSPRLAYMGLPSPRTPIAA